MQLVKCADKVPHILLLKPSMFNLITLMVMTTVCPSSQLQLSGQSYKHFTSVNYDPRVITWAIF